MTMANASFVSVLTLNTWNREERWPQRLSLLRRGLDALQPDLIGFQEVVDPGQAEEILAGLGYTFEWVGTEQSGIAVAARWPLSERAECWLDGEDGAPRGVALRARVRSPFGDIGFSSATTFYFANHHVAKRERQMPELAAFARGAAMQSGWPPVLVGDFNADPDSAEMRFMRGLQSLGGRGAYFCDAWAWAGDGGLGATWSNTNPHAARWHWPDRRIDYVLVGHPRSDGAGLVEDCRLALDQPVEGVWASDHFGVFAKLSAGSN